ncbi:hypothetical protein [Williamsia sterculiae]|nr:hypothetical protein [Williamsia sterculiae]
MYSFVSTGAISDRLSVEIDREYLEADMNDRHELRTWMVLLGAYVNGIGERGPVDGWNRIWIDRGLNEPSDSSASCGEHFSDPHAVGCALENDESEPLSLGEVIRRKFIGVSTASLIRHMEQAEDFSTDDEEVELSRRMREIGKTWCWSPGFTDPRIEVSDGGES